MSKLTKAEIQNNLLERFFELRDSLRVSLKNSAKSVFTYGRTKKKRLVFVIEKGSALEAEVKETIELIEKTLIEYQNSDGKTRRATWIPHTVGPNISQINLSCSNAFSSTKISAKKAQKLIETYQASFKLPSEKGKYRLVKPTGLDYRAKIWNSDGTETKLRPYGYLVVIEDPKNPVIINLPSDRPRKIRSDSRIFNEKPVFTVGSRLWIFRDK